MTSKRQVTFPKRVMDKLRIKSGDSLSLKETAQGILIRPHRFDIANFAPLRDHIASDLPTPDYQTIRHAALDPRLRD